MLLRIGEKIINQQKIYQIVDEILEMRKQGMSQQEVANHVGVDRTFVSRLETVGEIRKGERVAMIGFPIKNCGELQDMAKQVGIDYCFVLTEQERWDFVQTKSGIELFNDIMKIISILRQYDVVIMIGSNMRIKLMETLLDKELIGVQIGESPIEEDKYVNPGDIRDIITKIHR